MQAIQGRANRLLHMVGKQLVVGEFHLLPASLCLQGLTAHPGLLGPC